MPENNFFSLWGLFGGSKKVVFGGPKPRFWGVVFGGVQNRGSRGPEKSGFSGVFGGSKKGRFWRVPGGQNQTEKWGFLG